MKRLMVISLVVTMILTIVFPISAFASEKKVTFVFNYTTATPGENGKPLECSSKVTAKFKVANLKKNNKLVFETSWNKSYGRWEIDLTEGTEFISDFAPIPIPDLSNYDATAGKWEYTCKGNIANKISMTCSTIFNYRDNDLIDLFLFDKYGHLVYTMVLPFGTIGTHKVAVPKRISKIFSSSDSVDVTIEGAGLTVGAVCLLVDVENVEPLLPERYLLRFIHEYNSSNIKVSKALASMLHGKESILIPTNNGAAKIDIQKCSTTEDTVFELQHLRQYNFPKEMDPISFYISPFDSGNFQEEFNVINKEFLAWSNCYDPFESYTYIFDRNGTLLDISVTESQQYNHLWNLDAFKDLYWLPDISMLEAPENIYYPDTAPNIVCLIADKKYPDRPELYCDLDYSVCTLTEESFEFYSKNNPEFPFNVIVSGETESVFHALGKTSITVPISNGELIIPLNTTETLFASRITEGITFNPIN